MSEEKPPMWYAKNCIEFIIKYTDLLDHYINKQLLPELRKTTKYLKEHLLKIEKEMDVRRGEP